MQSNGQDTSWGSVKRSSGVSGPYLLHYWPVKRRDRDFAHAQLIIMNGPRAKIRRCQGHFSTVKNLDPGRSSGHSAYGSDHPLSIVGSKDVKQSELHVLSRREVYSRPGLHDPPSKFVRRP
jgi:hypothetical protein